MRNDWETPPTVEELIVQAWIGEDGQPDVLHVQAWMLPTTLATLIE